MSSIDDGSESSDGVINFVFSRVLSKSYYPI